MNMPFTQHEFLEVFKSYNEGIWPLQMLASCVGLAIILLTLRRRGASPALVLSSLAGMWLVNGTVYHWIFFSNINPVARGFGFVFIFQAVLLAMWSVRFRGTFEALADGRARAGLLLAVYALVIYPVWGLLAGHGYPYSPMFGVAPCPTTIFTLGMLLMGQPRLPKWLFGIPLVWAVIGTSAAFALGIQEDLGLGISALVALAFLFVPRAKKLGPKVPLGGQHA